MSTYSVRRLIA